MLLPGWRRAARRLINTLRSIRWLPVEPAVVFGERGECGLGLPRHVGVALAAASLAEHSNQAGACHVEIFVRWAAVRQIISRERVHERAVNALRMKDVQQFA